MIKIDWRNDCHVRLNGISRIEASADSSLQNNYVNVREDCKLSDANWGGLPDEHHLGKPMPLFPRIDT